MGSFVVRLLLRALIFEIFFPDFMFFDVFFQEFLQGAKITVV